MSISGHRTVSTFQRYNVINAEDKKLAMKKIEQAARNAMAGKKASETATKTENDAKTKQISRVCARAVLSKWLCFSNIGRGSSLVEQPIRNPNSPQPSKTKPNYP